VSSAADIASLLALPPIADTIDSPSVSEFRSGGPAKNRGCDLQITANLPLAVQLTDFVLSLVSLPLCPHIVSYNPPQFRAEVGGSRRPHLTSTKMGASFLSKDYHLPLFLVAVAEARVRFRLRCLASARSIKCRGRDDRPLLPGYVPSDR
jgi:hypothetical protein